MLGYLQNEKATKEMLTEDGWLRTGSRLSLTNRSVNNLPCLIMIKDCKEEHQNVPTNSDIDKTKTNTTLKTEYK